MTASVAPPSHVPRPLLTVEPLDRMTWLKPLLGFGLLGAAYLRLSWPTPDVGGPLHAMGAVDPLCGGTRGMSALVRGDVAAAWSWNPIVPVLAVGALLAIVRLAVGWLAGRWVNLGGPSRAWWMVLAVVAVSLQVNQQLQADRLIDAPAETGAVAFGDR